jgi:hypothetical protein
LTAPGCGNRLHVRFLRLPPLAFLKTDTIM